MGVVALTLHVSDLQTCGNSLEEGQQEAWQYPMHLSSLFKDSIAHPSKGRD